MPARDESPRFAQLALGVALVVAVCYLRFHTAWRDELQAWALVRASPSFAALWANLRPEAHPLLWYLLLGAAQKITPNPIALAPLHSALACAAIWLLVRHAPFSRPIRALIALSPFVLVQYFALARGYVLIELLAFACCIELRGKRRPLCLALLLGLLAQSEIQGAILGAGLCAAWLWLERVQPVARDPRARRIHLLGLISGLALYGASAIFCAVEVLRRAGMPTAPDSLFHPVPPRYAFATYCLHAFEALVPALPDLHLSARFVAHPALIIPLSVGLLAAMTWSLTRSPAGLLCWTLSTAGMLALGRLVAIEARHDGLIFIAFIAASWLAAPVASPPQTFGPGRGSPLDARAIFVALLFAQMALFGPLEFARELVRPNSAGPEVVRYLQREGLTAMPMICDIDFTATSVVAPLDRECYLPSIGASSRFTRWGPRRHQVGPAELQSATAQLLADAPAVLLVLSYPLQAPLPGATLLAEFTHAENRDERFYLYRAVR